MTIDRRQFVTGTATRVRDLLARCTGATPAEPGVVRVASVKTAVERAGRISLRPRGCRGIRARRARRMTARSSPTRWRCSVRRAIRWEDLGEAFARIAGTRSKFVLNDIDGVHYLTEIEIRGSPASAAVGAGGAGADRRAIAQVEATTWKS